MILLAIDPGAEHCGWCLAAYADSDYDDGPTSGGVLSPAEMYGFVWEATGMTGYDPKVDEIVIEEYRVLSDSANRYGTLETIEVIGVIKYLAQQANIPVIMQQTGIKKPTKGKLLGNGVKSVVPRTLGELRNHAVDAELHAWHRIWRRQECPTG